MTKTDPTLIFQYFMSNCGTILGNISQIIQVSVSDTQKSKKFKWAFAFPPKLSSSPICFVDFADDDLLGAPPRVLRLLAAAAMISCGCASDSSSESSANIARPRATSGRDRNSLPPNTHLDESARPGVYSPPSLVPAPSCAHIPLYSTCDSTPNT